MCYSNCKYEKGLSGECGGFVRNKYPLDAGCMQEEYKEYLDERSLTLNSRGEEIPKEECEEIE